MKIEIKVEELRKKKLFVAIPAYAGQLMGMFMKSCLDLQAVCIQYGVELKFSFIFNESLIPRARNYLADEFLRSGFTHLMFIDADIHFNPKDVITLLAMEKDVVGAAYPKKSIKWSNIKEALLKNPNLDAGELPKLVGDYVFNAVGGTGQFNIGEPLEVLEIGTGFMLIHRDVFERFKVQYPETSYKPDHVGTANFGGERYINAFFDCPIDRKRTIKIANPDSPRAGQDVEVGGSDRYLSEDYAFCQMVRNGDCGKIWICPWIKLAHIGTYVFEGDLPAIANHVGKL